MDKKSGNELTELFYIEAPNDYNTNNLFQFLEKS